MSFLLSVRGYAFTRRAHGPGPLMWALLAMAAYTVLMLPVLATNHFNVSAFIVAGDRFVDAHATATPIIVRPHSNGYDGQFYYRMAVSPLSFNTVDHGIHFDAPPWRMQRIVYPVLAWLASLGSPAYAPAAMFGVNLAGIGVIAAMAVLLSRRARLSGFVPLAMVMWPGYLVCLSHDTTEITSEALLLVALLFYVRRQPLLYLIAGALATLTREITVLVFAGLLAYDAAIWWKTRERTGMIIGGALLLLPFVAWREILTLAWHEAPQQQGLSLNIGPPFAGIPDMLRRCILGGRPYASTHAKDLVVRGIVVFTALPLIAFCVLVASRLPGALRRGGPLAPLAASWALLAALATLFRAGGPWIDPAGYFRAFSECYSVGCLVLGASLYSPSRPRLLAALGFAIFLVIWMFSLTQLRASLT